MRPQFKLSPEALQSIWRAGTSSPGRRQTGGVMKGVKSSGRHYLSVRVREVDWAGRAGKGKEEYPVRLLPGFSSLNCSHLTTEYHQSLLCINTLLPPIEPLHICRSICCYEPDLHTPLLRLKFTVVYPEISLQFTPVESVKCMPFASSGNQGFELGFLVQESTGWVSFLTRSEANLTKKPFIGIWASGIPGGNQPSEYPFLHPLVWSASVQYLQMNKPKLYSYPDSHPSFLFVYVSNKVSFYEVGLSVRSM